MPRALVSTLVVSLLGLAAMTAVAGCGGNACQDAQERVAECLGADEPGGDDIPDEDCKDDAEASSECLLDQSCEDLNSGQAYVTCAQGQ